MLDRIKIKKAYLLLGGFILLFVAGYPLAFKKTLLAWEQNKRLRMQSADVSPFNYRPMFLQRKAENIKRIIQGYEVDTLAFRNNVLDRVAIIAEKESVSIIDAPLSPGNGNKPVKLVFEGNYFQLISFLNTVERTNGLGYLRSAAFKMRKGAAKANPALTLELWWQNLQ